jgi:hypothetical protein
MKPRISLLLMAVMALCAALWLALTDTARAGEPAKAPEPAHQILVMLRMPADHYHPDAGYSGSYGDGAALAARRRVAERLARSHGLKLATSWPMPHVGVDCFVMDVPAGRSTTELAAELSAEPVVEWSQPMQAYRAMAGAAPPNDPLFRLQPAAQAWRLADLHAVATGRRVKVAVVDSTVEAAHPDLAGQLDLRANFVTGHAATAEQHGTGVAGIIAAIDGNRLGVSGVAPGARLMALRACWQETAAVGTVCDTLSLAQALHFAVDHGAQVINLSLSGPPDRLLGRLLDIAISRGIVVVAALDPQAAGGGFPASHSGVVAVTDDPALRRAGVVLAPGRDVPTTQVGGQWGLVSGSSYAAAHVSGLFALLREHRSGVQNTGALTALRTGSAGIDACASLLGVSGPCDGCACSRPLSSATMASR